jgi:hypothetical protein
VFLIEIGNTISLSNLDYHGSDLVGSHWSNQYNFVEGFVTSLRTTDKYFACDTETRFTSFLFVCTYLQHGGDATGLMSAIMMQYT